MRLLFTLKECAAFYKEFIAFYTKECVAILYNKIIGYNNKTEMIE